LIYRGSCIDLARGGCFLKTNSFAFSLIFVALFCKIAFANGLLIDLKTVSGLSARVDLEELQHQTLAQSLDNKTIFVSDENGSRIEVSRVEIGRGLTRKLNPIYTGQARLIGQELTFTDIRFGGEGSNDHFLELWPEEAGSTTPQARLLNRLITQNFCGFFGYVMKGYQNSTKWKSSLAYPEYSKFKIFEVVVFDFPGVFAGFGSSFNHHIRKPSFEDAHIATEIKCSTALIQ
jgi:hypothetical protein